MKYAAILALLCGALLISQPSAREQVGPLPDGGFLLNNGWKLHPAGKQIPLDTLPMSTALTKDGKYLLVLNGGYLPPSVAVLDTATMQQVSSAPVADGWLGLALSPDNSRVYVGGGSRSAVFEFGLSNGKLTAGREFTIVPADKRAWEDFVGDVALSPDGRLIYAAMLYRDSIAVINPQSGMIIERFKTGRRPYRILFHPDGKSLFVTGWGDGSLNQHAAETGERLSLTRLGPHPTDIVWSARKPDGDAAKEAKWAGRLFIPAANTNKVYVLAVSEAKSVSQLETINVSMTPMQPLGMTPTAVALSKAETTLYVACSDANAVAVADVSGASSKVLGFIPTGWYPTAVQTLSEPVDTLIVLNGRGLGSKANPHGPAPIKRPEIAHLGTQAAEYVGRIQTGTASVIDPVTPEQLDKYTRTVIANSPYNDSKLEVEVGIPDGNPVPQAPGMPTPIKHVIYIVKENRTYDQVFGDLGKGNGDPSLVIFRADSTPNHRKLANEFVLFDNFYVNSDVSADGHNWATAAISPDYVNKLWPNSYAGRRKHHEYDMSEPAAGPPAGYLWDNAISAGVSVRNYGYMVNNRPKKSDGGAEVLAVRDPLLAPVTHMGYRGFDLDYKDIDRVKVFLADLAEYEKKGELPQLILLRLGSDHTSGTAAGKTAPLSMMADNDLALGQVVEAMSKSRFWASTAIFVVEDDAQNGADHVDSHRSPAFVLSPYTRRGIIDSTMYNQTSILRTMELILGLRPMTVFDAGSRPMAAAFAMKPDLTPYKAEPARISLDEKNPAAAATAARSAKLDFSDADRIDDDELNAILWLAIRKTEPPAPTRSIFAR